MINGSNVSIPSMTLTPWQTTGCLATSRYIANFTIISIPDFENSIDTSNDYIDRKSNHYTEDRFNWCSLYFYIKSN